jgi:hypothetical protein
MIMSIFTLFLVLEIAVWNEELFFSKPTISRLTLFFTNPTGASISEAMLVPMIPKASGFLSPQAKNCLQFPKFKQ